MSNSMPLYENYDLTDLEKIKFEEYNNVYIELLYKFCMTPYDMGGGIFWDLQTFCMDKEEEDEPRLLIIENIKLFLKEIKKIPFENNKDIVNKNKIIKYLKDFHKSLKYRIDIGW